jgi:hypothetical protein
MSARTTRRDLFGASTAAMLVMTAPAEGKAKVAGIDADLLAACGEYLRLHDAELPLRAIMRGDDDEAGDRAYDYCDTKIWDRQDELTGQIRALSAKTPEGIRSKAQVTQIVLSRAVMATLGETFEEQAERHEMLVMSLLQDMVGRREA